MLIRLIVLVLLAGAAVGIAMLLQRRRPDPPTAPSYRAPTQLDRDDFSEPDKSFLAVVFASTTCNSCPEVWATIEALGTTFVAVQRVNVQDQAELHKRYRIDGVPTTLFADASGVVIKAFFGPLDADSLRDVLLTIGPEPS
ncbi:MAG: thioredoxin domain-containing protein [Acidimicrobiales bacterium]